MPTYNSARYLQESVQSVLAQTFSDFELIVVDDGSTDHTSGLLDEVRDSRVVVRSLERNSGLAAARNAGLELCRGSLIAWLDSDDVSQPDRLMRQVTILERQPRVGLCGTWVRTMGAGERVWRYPRKSDVLASRMVFDDPYATSSVMVRRKALTDAGGFDSQFAPAEDYDLWERVSRVWDGHTLPRVLTRYRLHDAQTSVRDHIQQSEAIRQIQVRQLTRLGIAPTPEEWRVHALLGVGWGVGLSQDDLPVVKDWLLRLVEANNAQRAFPPRAFASVVSQRLRIAEQACRPSRWRSASIRLHTALQ